MDNHENEPLNSNIVGDQGNYDDIPLKFTLSGRPAFTSVTVHLDQGEKVKSDSGAMIWMDADTKVKTSMDGVCNAFCRSWAGEGGCFNTYTGPGSVTVAIPEPGDILPFVVTPDHPWILGARTFVAGSENVKVTCQCGCGSLCRSCLGEPMIMTHISSKKGSGIFFAGGYGQIIKHEVPEGQSLFVNNSLFFAAPANIAFNISILGGCKTCLFGKEGLVMRFNGPTVVYTQSRNPRIMDRMVNSLRNSQKAKDGTPSIPS